MRTAVMTVLVVAMLSVMGCAGKASPPPAPQATTVEVSYNDLLNQKRVHRDIDLAAGQTLRVILGTNASTGYKWAENAQISDTAVLAQTGHVAVASPNGMPGGSGTEMWTFSALNPGSANITTTYGQPWPGGEKDAWAFTATVTVR